MANEKNCFSHFLELFEFTITFCLVKQIFYFEHLTLAQYGALAGLIVLAALVMAAVSWAAKRLPEKKG